MVRLILAATGFGYIFSTDTLLPWTLLSLGNNYFWIRPQALVRSQLSLHLPQPYLGRLYDVNNHCPGWSLGY